MGIENRTAAITRDRPLYLQVQEGDSSIWFVIEDGRQAQQQGPDADDDIIFRRFELPQLSYRCFPHSLVVMDSKLYLIGGSKSVSNLRRRVTVMEYEFLDLEEKGGWRWRSQSSKSFSEYGYCTQHMASCRDGLIYGLGRESYILDPAGPVTTDISISGYVPRPLAISKEKIYAYGGGLNHLLSYDFKEKKWDCLFTSFWGDWAIGVVLVLKEEDSYLVAYGSRHPIQWEREKPGVWVFDIRRRQWLDEPVKGLDAAPPLIAEWAYVDVQRVYTYYFPRLFQVGMHRFALLWEDKGERYYLHCHKFTLQAPTHTD